jgi:Cu2+-exporting ATPase
VLLHDGEVAARFDFTEVPRPDARESVRWLSEQGYGLWLLSGDTQAHVTRLASSLGLDPARAFGGCTPEDKARRLRELGADHALYLGDGVNDALAFEAALLAGTPAIERPVMPSRSDFFLVGQGLAPLCEALVAARRLRAVVNRVLALSIAYNVLAIAASLAGWMSPLAAAISMPVSTLTLIFITVRGLRGGWQAPCSVTTPSWSVPTSSLQSLR